MSVKLLLAGRRGGNASLPSPPEDPRAWLRSVERWFRQGADEWLQDSHLETGPRGAPTLKLRLHPAAGEVSVLAMPDTRLVVSAETSAVGPGYHVFLCDLLRALGREFDIAWTDPDDAEGVGDPTGYFHTGDAGPVEVHMLAWLQASVGQVLRLRGRGESRFAMSMRFGHTFEHPGALLTPLGPRDERWLRGVYDDPRRGMDVFPWWKPGAGASARLGRAQCRLWTDVVWRAPLLDEERRLLREVARTLELAWREDPGLAYPWREWREVLGYLGVGGTLAEEVHAQAEKHPARGPPLGYRRGAVQVVLPAGWEIRIPGSLAEAYLGDGTWVARDHRRSVRFVPLEDSADDGVLPTTEERRALALEHRGKRVSGRASLHVEPGDCRLTALCSSGRHRALCVVSFDDPEEEDWALGTWRSLDHATAA
ncbi:hypothetical protein LZ198_05555 [Myxococcus sp. K15C18031901]|uniref:hypothetical protein n=1 Tax=Myxococcus dinghuensis TaxID=2906761 RepID=UPI0020A6EA5A|nr:hypothetical protein [Myxococcus dinghuensis]MCP3098344.1 hypothetical protein [Myxococcus dinghuensis]